MARINLETSLNGDIRFQNLLIKTGNVYIAKGMMCVAFELSQKYWLEHKGIPEKHFPKDLELLLEVDLAQRVLGQDGTWLVYVSGSSEKNAFLEKQQRAGTSKSPKKREAAKKNLEAALAQRRVKANLTQPIPISYSFSSSVSSSSSNLKSYLEPALEVPKEKPTKLKPKQSDSGKLDRKGILQHWLDEYQKAKGQEYLPNPSAKTNTQIKKIHEELGAEKAKELLSAYLRINKPYYVERGHSLGVFMSDISGVASWYATPEKNVRDLNRFKKAKEIISDDLQSQHESIDLRSLSHQRHGIALQQPLPSQAIGEIPREFDSTFNHEFQLGSDSDAFSDSDPDLEHLSEHRRDCGDSA